MANAPVPIIAPQWQNLIFSPGVLREPCPDDSRLILWLPTEVD
jgi:hypothetical protein